MPWPLPQALQLLFAEEAGEWYAASASPALHQAAATAYDALLAARSAQSGGCFHSQGFSSRSILHGADVRAIYACRQKYSDKQS